MISNLGGQPLITNIEVTSSAEQQHIFHKDTKKFDIQARNGSVWQFSYLENESDINFISVPSFANYTQDFIVSPAKLYFRIPDATVEDSEVLEVLEWQSRD